MRRRTALTALVTLIAVHSAVAQAPLSTAFTYQGRLEDGANPANAAYDFTFRLFDAAVGGVPIGGLVTVNDLLVSDGLFTTQLNFGSSPFIGDARWLAGLLSQLSETQIRDAFRAANYSNRDIDLLTRAVMSRISQLEAAGSANRLAGLR